MKRKLLIITAFVGVFAFGLLAGGVSMFSLGRTLLDRRVVELTTQKQWRAWADELQMTPEQRKEARTIILRTTRDRVAVQRDLQRINQRMERDLMEVLGPEQQKRFRALRGQTHQEERHWQKWLREQRRLKQTPPGADEPTKEGEGTKP
jgi:hypothetical protein